MNNFNRKLLKVINKLEAEALYLDHISGNNQEGSMSNTIKAQQIGMSEGIILATNVLRKQFDFDRKKSLEQEYEEYNQMLEHCA